MFRAFLTGMFSAIFVLAGLMPAASSAQTSPNLQLLSQSALDSSQQVKVPDVSVGGRTVLISGNRNRETARVWRKADTDPSFGAPLNLGESGDNTLFNNVASSATPDGGGYIVWFGPGETPGISGRRINPDGSLGGTETILGGGRNFRAYLDVAATADGTTVVVWSENGRFLYRYRSPATQNNWVGPNALSDQASQNIPILTTGPNNRIAITFGNAEGEIFAGTWTGTAFNIERLTNSGDFEADPSITLLPNGTPVVAWRSVNPAGRSLGYFFAVRQSNGSWPASRLSNISVFGIASVTADEAGNLSFAWTGEDGRLYVAYQTSNNVFEGPRVLSAGGDPYFIARAASNLNGRTLIHVPVERHGGRGLTVDYTLWAAQGGGTIGAKPVVESDAATSNKTTVQVNFSNVAGSPTQVRWRWGAPPTDAANDSNGWQPFANPLSVPVAPAVNTRDCAPETLFTQVRSGNLIENVSESDSITIDSQVTGSVRLTNPFIASKAAVFTPLADVNADGGASNGDPNYTRIPNVYVEVNGNTDCTGIAQFQYGASAQALGAPFGVVNNFFANTLSLPNPGDLTQGPRTVLLRVQDRAGNQIDFTRTVTFDTVAPVVADGAQLAITSSPQASVLANLTLSNLQVNDAYPGTYWGVWIANSLTPVTDPGSSTALNWTPVAVNQNDRTTNGATVRNWSLITGLGAQGRNLPANSTVYVYIRVLDGAGNPSVRVISQQVALPTATLPRTNLPIIRR